MDKIESKPVCLISLESMIELRASLINAPYNLVSRAFEILDSRCSHTTIGDIVNFVNEERKCYSSEKNNKEYDEESDLSLDSDFTKEKDFFDYEEMMKNFDCNDGLDIYVFDGSLIKEEDLVISSNEDGYNNS